MNDFIPLTVVDVRPETARAVAIALRVPDQQRASFQFTPGQFIRVRAAIGGETVERSYSICSDPSDRDLLIGVKQIPDGVFSSWANTQLRAGMTLDATPPQGRFFLRDPGEGETAERHILMLAAGAGITPVISILRFGLQRMPATRFSLVFGNRTVDDIMFREELEALKDRYVDRFTLIQVLSRTEQPDMPFLEGRIDAEKIRRLSDRLIGAAGIAHAYVCGPGAMIRDARQALFDLGLPRERVHQELFAPAGGAAALRQPGATAAPLNTTQRAEGEVDIIAILDGARRSFRLRPGETVIDAALRAGVRVPYACKGGMCCTCRAKLIEGHAQMRTNYSLEPWELERGFLLTCQAIPTTPRLVVDYDQL